jgi:hypothetical protein
VEKSKLVTWIEIGTGISVFVGLLLVAVELRQSNEHASAQSVLEFYNDWAAIYQFESQYQIDLLIGKAIEQPDQLTDAELYRLDDYYSLVISAFMVRELMEELGLNPVRQVSDQARTIVDEFFYYPVSRTWYALYTSWVEVDAPILDRAIRDAMSDSPIDDPAVWVNEWRRDFGADK